MTAARLQEKAEGKIDFAVGLGKNADTPNW
jgi:hypothetical protein